MRHEKSDPDEGIASEIGYITNTSPPIVVGGVVVVGNSNLTGRLDPRRENVAGDVLAFDARTGELRWKFDVIPQPGEFGHETWENDAWEWSGNINTWPPLSADLENEIVYGHSSEVPDDPATFELLRGYFPREAVEAAGEERVAAHRLLAGHDFPSAVELSRLVRFPEERSLQALFAMEPHYVRASEPERNPKFPPLPGPAPSARLKED